MRESFLWTLGLLARQVAKAAKRDNSLNDLADTLYVACVQAGLPEHLLPL